MGRKGVFRKLGGEVPDLLNGGNWEATFATSVGGGGWVWGIKGGDFCGKRIYKDEPLSHSPEKK